MKTTSKTGQVKREVGERVDVLCSLDPTTVKELGDGIFEATITTSHKDRTGEDILTTGVDAGSWEQTGMPVLYGHDYQGLPIGKGLSWKSFKNKMTARFQLAIEEYPFAGTVAAMIKGGYLNAVSIGGRVKKWSDDYMTIEELEMVEFSVVPVPANPNALITQRSLEQLTGKSTQEIKTEYEDFSRKILLDKLAGMPEDDVKDAIRILKTLIARLEETADASLLTGDKKAKTITRLILQDAKAVATQSEKVIKSIKLTIKEK